MSFSFARGAGIPDVTVVGGGPAGAWAAHRLAHAGARVLLFDHSHPREKPCGGGITSRAFHRVAEVLARRQVPLVPIESASFEADGAPTARVPLSDRPSGLVISSRREFDGALLAAAEEAGAGVVRERVIDVASGPSGVTIRTARDTYRSDWLIGADGANSLVRRRLGQPFRRSQLSIAAGYFVQADSSREIVIRFTSDPPGYLWSFPRIDHVAIGMCAPADLSSAARLRTDVRRWLDSHTSARGAPLAPYSWPIPTLSAADLDQQHPAGERWMLLGDAAGLVDPLTREGISFAIESAELAAGALAEAGSRAAHRYVDALQATMYDELRRAARLKVRFFSPRFTGLLLEALERSSAIRDVMADLLCGRQAYRGLRRRVAATCQLGFVWRLLLLELGR